MIPFQNLYPWQRKFIQSYCGKGILKAFPGVGKTDAILWLIKYRNIYPVIICVPTRTLKTQWEEKIYSYNLQNHIKTIYTFRKASQTTDFCNLLVVDECHQATSPVYRKLFKNILHAQIIGITATPTDEATQFCGNIIYNVPMQEAKKYIASFKVIFEFIDLTPEEQIQYRQLTQQIADSIRFFGKDSRETLFATMQRRNLVYNARNRIQKTIEILNRHPDLNTLIICQRIEQANELSRLTGISVFHSKNPDYSLLQKFQNNEIKKLISVEMLKEGFDKRDIQLLILTSTFITERYHIQTIGRAVRLPDDALIYIILARGTTDEKLLQYRDLYDYEIRG